MGALLLGEVGRDGGSLGGKVNVGDGALDNLDARGVEARNVRELDPVLLGVLRIGQGQRRADQVVCSITVSGLVSYTMPRPS